MSNRDEWRLAHEARSADKWFPEGVDRGFEHRRPAVGDVIAWDRRAWEVMHVQDAIPTDEEVKTIDAYRESYRDQIKPYRISLRRLHGQPHARENDQRDLALRAPAGMSRHRGGFAFYENGRVPLCSCCGDPWPCLLADAQRAAEASSGLMEARMARMMPGICYGCGEVITTRQGKVHIPGDHADFPGRAGPTFHTRQKCSEQRRAYERRGGIEPVTRNASAMLDGGER